MADFTSVATKVGREATTKAREFAETNAVAKKAKDVVYTAVGVGVIGAQKATAAVKSVHGSVDTDGVSAQVKKSVEDVTVATKRQAAWLDEKFEKTLKTVDAAIAPIEEKFPTVVRDAMNQAREATAKVRATVVTKAADADVTPEADAE